MKPKKKPTPDELLAEVHGIEAAKTYPFEDYLQVVHALQQKDYSYAKIAEFLKDRLGFNVSRGQVYRAYQQWLAAQQDTIEEESGHSEEPTFEDEYEEILEQNANALIEELREQEANGVGEPWNDPYSIVKRAAAILDKEVADAKSAEEAAAAADRALEEKGGKK